MTSISIFDHPQICVEIGLRDISAFGTFLCLSKTINTMLKEWIPVIREHYPYHGLRFPIYNWIHSDLGPLVFSSSQHWYCLDKRILPRIPVRPEFANIKTWQDLHSITNISQLTVNGDRLLTLWWGCSFLQASLEEPLRMEDGTIVIMESLYLNEDIKWGLQSNSAGRTFVVASIESGPFEMVSRSLPEFLSELFMLSDLFILKNNLDNHSDYHEKNPNAKAYLQALIPRWPRNPEGSYDFCSICGKGRFLGYSGERWSCKICPKFDVCADCIEDCDHWHMLHDCLQDSFLCFCSGCDASLWLERGFIFVCKESVSTVDHNNEEYCLQCVKSGKAKHRDCVCNIDSWLISNFCNECKKPISKDDRFYTCSSCPQLDLDNDIDSYDLCEQCKSITKHEHATFRLNQPPYKHCAWSQCVIDTTCTSYYFCRVCEQDVCSGCVNEYLACHNPEHIILSSDFGK